MTSSNNCRFSNKKNLDPEEKKLAEKLKEIWDENEEEEDPKQSAEIFYKMARIYKERSPEKISLIKSAVLYNAVLVRSPDNRKAESDLKQLCSMILKLAKAKNPNADLLKIAEKIKKEFITLRKEVEQQLIAIPCGGQSKDNTEQFEYQNQKITKIENLQKKISMEYAKIMNDLSHYCLDAIGNPPCKFAIVGMGSIARQEITPFSDFEHFIVLEDKAKNEQGYEDILDYFRWFSVVFQIVLVNMKETILPCMVIPSLNHHPIHGDWFYDRITPRGVCFDGMMIHASKFPLGRQKCTPNKPWTTELIRPISEMLKLLTTESSLKQGYKLKDILTRVCYISGEKLIFEDFKEKMLKLLESEQDSVKTFRELVSQIQEDLNSFSIRANLLKIKTQNKFNLKRTVYRSVSLFIAALGRVNKVHDSSSFDIIKNLAKNDKITKNTEHYLAFASATAFELRLRWYTKCNCQNDEIKSSYNETDDRQLISLVGKETVITYFKTVYALQYHICNLLQLDKKHFYSDITLFKCILSYCFMEEKEVIIQTKAYINSRNDKTKKLYEIDECLQKLFEKSEVCQSDEVTQNKKTLQETSIANLFEIGNWLSENLKEDEAKEFYEIIADIHRK